MTLDVVLAEFADKQLGVVTFSQVQSLGGTQKMMWSRVKSGAWYRMHKGIFLVTGTYPTWEQSALAAVFAAGNGAVVSHFSAATLWKFPDAGEKLGIEITTQREFVSRHTGFHQHQAKDLWISDTTHIGVIPVTTFARTLIDNTLYLSVSQLGRALDDGLRRGLVTLPELERTIDRLYKGPHRRTSVIDQLLDERAGAFGKCESRFEREVLHAIRQAELPEPELQYWINVRGSRYRLDMAYPKVHLAVEVDGNQNHSSPTDRKQDHERDEKLRSISWRTFRITREMSDTQITSTIADLLAS